MKHFSPALPWPSWGAVAALMAMHVVVTATVLTVLARVTQLPPEL
jgi:hypothetical protein